MFTAVCEVPSVKRQATASTKKDAKQCAARAVLEAIQNENQPQSTAAVSSPPTKLFRTYRTLRPNTQATSLTDKLRNRHNFLLTLPVEDRMRARDILLDKSGIYGNSNKDKIAFTCAALKLDYEIRSPNKNRQNFKVFTLKIDKDCVLMGNANDLYDRIIDYFKTMLNIESYSFREENNNNIHRQF